MKLTNQPHKRDDFDDLVSVMQLNVNMMKTPIFTISNTDELVDIWLRNMPIAERQHYNCNCCKRFLAAYGGIYTIDSDDVHRSLWAVEPPRKYQKAVSALEAYVLTQANRADKLAITHYAKPERGRLVRTFSSKEKAWIGSYETGQFTHFEFLIRLQDEKKELHYREAQERISSAAQGFRMNMAKIEAAVIKLADKRITPMFEFVQKWFAAKGPDRRNLVAEAHDGQTHWSGSVLGSMVDLFSEGRSIDEVISSTQKKLNPLAYQRPQVVAEGQIVAAEKAFEAGGWATALARRNLFSNEIPNSAVIWKSKGRMKAEESHTFSAVRQSLSQSSKRPVAVVEMSWAMFSKSILPKAKSIKVGTLSSRPATLTTAKNPKSKPILRHDSEAQRNPVAWWVPVSQREVMPAWSDVSQILRNVPEWYSGNTGDTVLLQLSDYCGQGASYSGLFPELLSHEVRAYRAVIERNNLVTTGCENNSEGVSCIQVTGKQKQVLRVETVTGTIMEVTIDRFE